METTVLYKILFDDSFSKPVDMNKIINVIIKLEYETAAGFDNLSIKLLKKHCIIKWWPLTHIYDNSLAEGIFPTKFKIAVVKSLFKNGNKEIMSYYKPISMICNLGSNL